MLTNDPAPRSRSRRASTNSKRLQIRLPRVGRHSVAQDHEWCEVLQGGVCRRVRFHDYHEIFRIPGLYEVLFYDCLKCCSPSRVAGLLEEVTAEAGIAMSSLRALDVGAGNGMVGEELKTRGVSSVVGLDIIPEAREATERDRPGVYQRFLVADLTKLPAGDRAYLRAQRFNCLSAVAALGFGDIPPTAFLRAFELLEVGGWMAFNIKEDFIHDKDTTGFCRLIRKLGHEGTIQLQAYRRYRHRFSINGEALYYVAVVAKKLRHRRER